METGFQMLPEVSIFQNVRFPHFFFLVAVTLWDFT